MQDQRVAHRHLGSIYNDLIGIRRSRISRGTPRLVRKGTLAKRTGELGFGWLAVVNGVGIAHGCRPLAGICIRTKRVKDWMINAELGIQLAVRNRRGYSEKLCDLNGLVLLCQVKTGGATLLRLRSIQ